VMCKKFRTEGLCPGCAKCLVASMNKEGEFSKYEDARIVGIIECGDCPGNRVANSLARLGMHVASLGLSIDVVHVGTCIVKTCPYSDKIINILKEKAGVDVVEGTHPYLKPKVLSTS